MKCHVLGPFYIFHCFRRWQTFQNYQQSRRRETWARILAAGGENNSKVKKSEKRADFLASKVIVGVILWAALLEWCCWCGALSQKGEKHWEVKCKHSQYVLTYYSKDDSGTIEYLKKAMRVFERLQWPFKFTRTTPVCIKQVEVNIEKLNYFACIFMFIF